MGYKCVLSQDILNIIGDFANYELKLINYKKKYEIKDLQIKKLPITIDLVNIIHMFVCISLKAIQRAYKDLFNVELCYSTIYRELNKLILDDKIFFYTSNYDNAFYYFCPCALIQKYK